MTPDTEPRIGTFHCSLYSDERTFRCFGLEKDSPENLMREAADFARHHHWCDSHRVCAKCGELVKGEDLAIAINDGSIQIHPDYTVNYETVPQGDIGHALIVHERCM